jgi:hypothetical protein
VSTSKSWTSRGPRDCPFACPPSSGPNTWGCRTSSPPSATWSCRGSRRTRTG